MARKLLADHVPATGARAAAKHATVQPQPPAIASDAAGLDSFAAEIERTGLVGEAVNAQIIFLALVSRRLTRPVSIVVKGASSSGKSEVVNRVLAFFPATAYVPLTAMSDKWLAHNKEPLSHRFL